MNIKLRLQTTLNITSGQGSKVLFKKTSHWGSTSWIEIIIVGTLSYIQIGMLLGSQAQTTIIVLQLFLCEAIVVIFDFYILRVYSKNSWSTKYFYLILSPC